MKIRLSADEIANEVRMHAVSHRGLFILVEGDSDELFYRNIFAFTSQEMIIAFGYENVLKAIAILDANGFGRALGIIDRDYHGLVCPMPASQNVLVTDDRDLEVMLFESPVMERIFDEVGSAPKIAKEPAGIAGIKKKIYEAALLLSRLRLLSAKGEVTIVFGDIKHSKFIDKKTLAADDKKLIAHLRGCHRKNGSISLATIQTANEYCNSFSPMLTGRQYCRGHDLTNIAAIGLRSLWGNNSAKRITADSLEVLLRMGVDKIAVRASMLGRGIITWFENHRVAV